MMLLALGLLAQEICAPCHSAQAKAHAATLMRNTLERGAEAAILRKHSVLEATIGPYRYRIENGRFRVTDGSRTIDATIHWAMGQGEAGQTYVLDRDGHLYESRLSFYQNIQGLGPTMGAPAGTPRNLEEALGRELTPKAVLECFGCHSAQPSPTPGIARGTLEWTQTLIPGVQCVSCHTDAGKHAIRPAIRPASLRQISAEEISEVCGRCHRTWGDVAANGPRGVGNVRFQPYRIARAKCYDAADRRIGCTACHHPHNRPNRKVALKATDLACASCHAKLCPTGAKTDCASCHMPKFELPGSHFRFTDHWIRVARNDEAYPD